MKKTHVLLLASSLLIIPHLSYGQQEDYSQVNLSSSSVESFPPPKNTDPNSHAPISILDFTDVSFPSSISKEEDLTISFSLKNNGNVGAKNIVIKAISQDIQGLVPKSISQVNAKYFAPKQEEKYSFSFKTTDNAQEKNYAILLSIAYTDENTGELHQSKQLVTTKVKGDGPNLSGNSPLANGDAMTPIGSSPSFTPSPSVSAPMDMGPSLPLTPSGADGQKASQGSNVPKVIIDEYNFDPKTVQSGRPFTLHLRIFNTHRKKTIRNIRVSLTADSAETIAPSSEAGPQAMQAPGSASAFTPIGSSNTFHIETIKARKYFNKELTLTTSPDLAPKAYTITANFEYEDGDGNPYQSSEIIGIPVVQNSEITFGDLQLEEGATVGMPLPLSVEFYNTGKAALSNVIVKFRGNFNSDTSTYFVGSLAPGASDSYDANITPEQAGKQKGEIVISYDDASGVKQEIIKPFTVNVEEETAMSEENTQEANGQGPSWALPLGIGGMVILLGAIGAYLWRKKKNTTKDEDLKV